MPVELVRLSAVKLKTLPPTQTVFFFPVAGVEDHGPHLPMGLKLAEARKLCELAAERLEKELPGWTGVLMPEAPLAVDCVTSDAAVRVRAHVLRDWLIDSCRSLAHLGFRNFVCFSGHLGPRQLTAIEEAGKMLVRGRMFLPSSLWTRGRHLPTLVSACSAVVPASEVKRSPLWPDPKEHGGARDTRLALDLMPDAVDPSYATLPARSREGGFWSRGWEYLFRRVSGYWGTPSDAAGAVDGATHGQGLLQLHGKLDDIFPKLRALWDGANPNQLFRSWYSVIPPNKGFFLVWTLAFICILVLWLWAWITVSDLVG